MDRFLAISAAALLIAAQANSVASGQNIPGPHGAARCMPEPPTPIVPAPRLAYYVPPPYGSAPYFQQPGYYPPYLRPFDNFPPYSSNAYSTTIFVATPCR